MMDVKKSLPMVLLKQIKKKYPSVFDQLDRFRYDETLNDLWPHGQIFVPVAASVSLFSNSQGITDAALFRDMETVAAVAGWRQQKNIYAVDEAVAQDVYAYADTTATVDTLKLLAWSMYIQPQSGEMLPGLDTVLDGFFVYWDLDKDVYELRFLPVSTTGQQFPVITLSFPRDGKVTIAQAIENSVAKADDVYAPAFLRDYLTHWVGLVQFISSDQAVLTADVDHAYKAAKQTLRDIPQEVQYLHVTK